MHGWERGIARSLKESPFSTGGRWALTLKHVLKCFIHGDAVDQRLTREQAGFMRARLALQAAPYIHGGRPYSKADQSAVGDMVAFGDGVCVRPYACHAVPVTANQHSCCRRQWEKPGRICSANMKRARPDCLLVSR